jgi:hypothetical protein
MSSQHPAAQNFDFDFAPAMKLFTDNMEVWKQNCEQVMKSSSFAPALNGAALMPNPAEQAIGNWKAAGEALFKTAIEQQIELCRFFGKRWETYLEFPRRLAACKTPAEVAEIEIEFVKRLTSDYSEEGAKLVKPVSAFMNALASGRLTQ